MESGIANNRSWPLDYLSEVSFEDPFDVVFKLEKLGEKLQVRL